MAVPPRSNDSARVSLRRSTDRLGKALVSFLRAQRKFDYTGGKKAQVEIEMLRRKIFSAVDVLEMSNPEDLSVRTLASVIRGIRESLVTTWAKRAMPLLESFSNLTHGDSRSVWRFPTPKGSTWGQVHIHLISPEEAQIELGETKLARNFVSLGFADRRKANQPDNLWLTLRILATSNGVFERKNFDTKRWQKVQKNIQLLRKKLKAIFDIVSDPIPYDWHQKHYQTAFLLTALEQARVDLSKFRRLGSKKLR